MYVFCSYEERGGGEVLVWISCRVGSCWATGSFYLVGDDW